MFHARRFWFCAFVIRDSLANREFTIKLFVI